MKIGDRFECTVTQEVLTVSGFSINYDAIFLQTASTEKHESYIGQFNRPMGDDSGDHFICMGYSMGFAKHTLLDVNHFTIL